MSRREAFFLADRLMHTGIMELDILGGEPLLIPYMRNFLEYVTGAGFTVHISTNGSLPDLVHTIAKIPTRLLHIGFSLHGFADIHNVLTGSANFNMVIKCIRETIFEGGTPIVKSVLTPMNRGEIADLVHYLAELGVKRYFLLHEDIIGRGEYTEYFSFPEFMKYFSVLRSQFQGILDIGFVAASGFYKYGPHACRRCDAGITKLAVLPDGSTFPCNLLLGYNEFHLGNIMRDSLDSILSHPVLERFRISNSTVCTFSRCAHYTTCSGGCPAHSYSFYRHMEARDPRCQYNDSDWDHADRLK